MPKRAAPRQPAPQQLSHEMVEHLLFSYHYGRLSPEQNAAVEGHVRSCALCREGGLSHIVTERMHAMQQRAKSHRRVPRPFVFILSIALALLVGIAGFALYTGARDGALGQSARRNVPHNVLLTTPSAPASPTPLPATLKAGTAVGPRGAVSLAWSPDGNRLAVGANPAAFGGVDPGGVAIYATGAPTLRLAGFEGREAPGALLWSPDGKRIAAAGRASIIVWDAMTGSRLSTLLVPADPGNTLSIFTVVSGTVSGTVPASIFAATGFAQWGANGKITAAPTPAGASIPAATGPVIALWGSQEGTRIFRDASDTTLIGTSDDDRNAHAAFMRWSPDGRYLLWGYPRLPISSTVVANGGTTTPPTADATTTVAAISAPDVTFAALVNRVGQATATGAAIIVWPSGDGARLALYDTTTATPVVTIVAVATDATIGTFPAFSAPMPAPLAMLSWQAASTIKMTLTTGSQAVSYANGA